MSKRRMALPIALLSLILLLPSVSSAQIPVVRVGLVFDGPSERNEEIRRIFESEIIALLEGEFTAQFPPQVRLEADWTAAGVKGAVSQLLADPEVDLVVTLGILSSADASLRGPLRKPLFAAAVLFPELQGIPLEIRERRSPDVDEVERIRVSGVSNLSYVSINIDLFREIEIFREIVPFSRLTVLGMEALADEMPKLEDKIEARLAAMDLEIEMVGVGESLDQTLAQIPADTQAVYVGPLLHLSSAEFGRLVAALIERKLPSFSLWGRKEAEKGVLASLGQEQDKVALARRVALNIQHVLLGGRPEELPVDFERDERLTINMATARAIGVSPRFVVLTEAELLNEALPRAARSLSLSSVIREASVVNLDLAVADRTVAVGLQQVREARSPLLPQVDISGLGRFIDKDRAEGSFGRQGQRQIAGTLGGSQLIYSDQAWANYRIEQQLQELRHEERAQLRLDIILEAAQGYLSVLRAKTIERIQKDNLRVTRSHLELARSRVEIGAAGPEEVFRWESQIAINRRDVIQAMTLRSQTEIALNRTLYRPIEEIFMTMEAALDDPELITSFEQLRSYIETPVSFKNFRDFMAREAYDNSPELRQLNASVAARERALLATKRVFYIPTVALLAGVTGFGNAGAGSDPPQLPFGLSLDSLGTDDVDWFVGINATLPLFQGGGLRARRTRAEEELEEVRLRRDATRERIEQRIRSTLYQTGASFVSIDLTRTATEAAHKNLDLVTGSYSEGLVDNIKLLDAQTQALVADLDAANAIHDYLLDLMAAQRAVGRFDYYRSARDQQEFLNRLLQYFRQAGY